MDKIFTASGVKDDFVTKTSKEIFGFVDAGRYNIERNIISSKSTGLLLKHEYMYIYRHNFYIYILPLFGLTKTFICHLLTQNVLRNVTGNLYVLMLKVPKTCESNIAIQLDQPRWPLVMQPTWHWRRMFWTGYLWWIFSGWLGWERFLCNKMTLNFSNYPVISGRVMVSRGDVYIFLLNEELIWKPQEFSRITRVGQLMGHELRELRFVTFCRVRLRW